MDFVDYISGFRFPPPQVVGQITVAAQHARSLGLSTRSPKIYRHLPSPPGGFFEAAAREWQFISTRKQYERVYVGADRNIT